MKLIDDLKKYKKSHLNDSYHNLSVLTGIEQNKLMEIIDEIAIPTKEEKELIERLIY